MTIENKVGEVQGGCRSPNEMADALERIAGGALSYYEGCEADELHILRCAKLIRDLAARQPGAQKPAFYLTKADADYIAGRNSNANQVVAIREPRSKSAVPFYTAPPAQGIDLERARDKGHDGAIRYVLGYLNGVGDWGSTQYVEILDACGRERIIRSAVQDGELEFTGLGRWVAERGTEEDRALIDGQRDAAPGVGS